MIEYNSESLFTLIVCCLPFWLTLLSSKLVNVKEKGMILLTLCLCSVGSRILRNLLSHEGQGLWASPYKLEFDYDFNFSNFCIQLLFISLLHFICNQSEDNLQLELGNASSWCENRRLYFNFAKLRRKLPFVHIRHYQLANVSSAKILVCIFPQDLKLILFVESLVKKASKCIWFIWSLAWSA